MCQRPKLCNFTLPSNFCYSSPDQAGRWKLQLSVLQEDPDLYWNVKLESGLLFCASAENPALHSEQKIRSFITQEFILIFFTADCPHSSVQYQTTFVATSAF